MCFVWTATWVCALKVKIQKAWKMKLIPNISSYTSNRTQPVLQQVQLLEKWNCTCHCRPVFAPCWKNYLLVLLQKTHSKHFFPIQFLAYIIKKKICFLLKMVIHMNRELGWIGRVFCKLRKLIPHRNALCWVWVSNNILCWIQTQRWRYNLAKIEVWTWQIMCYLNHKWWAVFMQSAISAKLIIKQG